MSTSKFGTSSQFFSGRTISAWLGSLFLMGALTACGGGGGGGDDVTEYKGKTTAASVNESNKEDLAVFESNATGTDFTINYRDFCEGSAGERVVFNGTFDYEEKGDFSFYRYRNFVVRSNGETQRIDNLTIKCSTSTGFGIGCEVISDFAGTNGRTYRISNATFSGSAESGYDVEARVFDGDHGYIDIVATGLIPCESGGFSSGSIVVTDSSDSEVLEITFVSCSEMTVTFNGNAETIAQ